VKTRTKRILWFAPIVIVAAYTVALIRFRSEPSGYVTAYSVIGHTPSDAFDFHDGTVTIRTCCGDLSAGTYTRSAGGAWLWQFRYGDYKVDHGDYFVQSGLFSMRFTDAKTPSKEFTLRRRVSLSLPL
jgi:hypothetical protein